MSTITISIDDDVEASFRQTAETVIGKRKGYLGSAITEAIQHWLNEKHNDDIANRQLGFLSTGFKMGKLKVKCRDELYDR